MPERIQLRRTRGWRKPADAIVVARPSQWGNPWRPVPAPNWPRWAGPRPWHVVAPSGALMPVDLFRQPRIYTCRAEALRFAALAATQYAVDLFREHTAPQLDLEPLRGHDLACWCPLVDANGERVPCHADVLLELANQEPTNG